MGVQIVYGTRNSELNSNSHSLITELSQAVTDEFNLLLELFMTNGWVGVIKSRYC